MADERPSPGTARLRLVAIAACAGIAGAACYGSYARVSDGDREVGRDDGGRDDGGRDDGGVPDGADGDADADADASGVAFTPDPGAGSPGTVSLRADSLSPASVVIAIEVTAGDRASRVFGVAARLRYDSAMLSLRSARSCGPFDLAGPAVSSYRQRPPGDPEPGRTESWFGIATADRERLVSAGTTACAMLAAFDVLAPGSTRIDVVPGHSAGIGLHPADFVASAVAGGLLEVRP